MDQPRSSVPGIPLFARSAVPFDLAYLEAEIEELRRMADQSGLGTLAYLLECAAIETRWQIQQKQDAEDARAAR